MKSVCNGFDRYVKDFYPFVINNLQDLRGAEPPLTRVLVIRDAKEWKRTLRLVHYISGMSENFAKDANAVWWMMPATLDERLALGSEILSDSWVDYDAYIALNESKFITPENTLSGRQFYSAMASACIQLSALKARNLKGTGKVVHDPQAIELFEKFRERVSDATFRELYFP